MFGDEGNQERDSLFFFFFGWEKRYRAAGDRQLGVVVSRFSPRLHRILAQIEPVNQANARSERFYLVWKCVMCSVATQEAGRRRRRETSGHLRSE